MNVMIFLFHLIIFALYMFTLIYETLNIPTAPHRKTYAGRFKFLTFWNQVCDKLWTIRTAGISLGVKGCGIARTCGLADLRTGKLLTKICGPPVRTSG